MAERLAASRGDQNDERLAILPAANAEARK
jgi:hypothetical protein